jgi:hypothetical protein
MDPTRKQQQKMRERNAERSNNTKIIVNSENPAKKKAKKLSTRVPQPCVSVKSKNSIGFASRSSLQLLSIGLCCAFFVCEKTIKFELGIGSPRRCAKLNRKWIKKIEDCTKEQKSERLIRTLLVG